jgi:hypothetical protein
VPELDPAWEYWTPADPEVAELLAEAAGPRHPWDALGVEPYRLERGGGLAGVRFGAGSPDRWEPREGRGPAARGPDRPALPDRRACAGCGGWFRPARASRRYCSRACVPRPGAARALPAAAACAGCGKGFAPRAAAARFCSRRCAAGAGGRAKARVDPGAFAAGYLAGEPMARLGARFGVRVAALKRLRRKLGLPARPPGAPRGKKTPDLPGEPGR